MEPKRRRVTHVLRSGQGAGRGSGRAAEEREVVGRRGGEEAGEGRAEEGARDGRLLLLVLLLVVQVLLLQLLLLLSGLEKPGNALEGAERRCPLSTVMTVAVGSERVAAGARGHSERGQCRGLQMRGVSRAGGAWRANRRRNE